VLFWPGAPWSPMRTEDQPTALAHEPTAVHSYRDPVTAEPLVAELVVAGYPELLVENALLRNNMKLHHKQPDAHQVWSGGHGSMAR
jgi:hypothetical protein